MEESIKTHKDLRIWKSAMNMVEEIYKLTGQIPKHELYGLTSQIRRSAVSIPSNIAEGAARNSKKEFLQFLYVALGSLAELETQLIIAHRLHYISSFPDEMIEEVRKPLVGLIKALKRKENE